jgi:hypothetical protein
MTFLCTHLRISFLSDTYATITRVAPKRTHWGRCGGAGVRAALAAVASAVRLRVTHSSRAVVRRKGQDARSGARGSRRRPAGCRDAAVDVNGLAALIAFAPLP